MRPQWFANREKRKEYLDEWEKSQITTRFYYYHLGIIDTKSSVLLRVNALYFAVIAFVFSRNAILLSNSIGGGLRVIIIITVLLAVLCSFVSSLLGLSVVWLHWFTLEDLVDLNENKMNKMNQKFDVLEARTFRYRIAWISSLVAFLLTSFLIILHICMS